MVLCGGSESMSQAPYAVRNIRFGTKFGFDLKVGFWLIFFLMPKVGMHDNIGHRYRPIKPLKLNIGIGLKLIFALI